MIYFVISFRTLSKCNGWRLQTYDIVLLFSGQRFIFTHLSRVHFCQKIQPPLSLLYTYYTVIYDAKKHLLFGGQHQSKNLLKALEYFTVCTHISWAFEQQQKNPERHASCNSKSNRAITHFIILLEQLIILLCVMQHKVRRDYWCMYGRFQGVKWIQSQLKSSIKSN